MSQRKLQQDIDKLLKKVKEGLEDYDDVYEKLQASDPSNASYREKLEADLKREVKKLQKHRDQIKTWLSKEDVKDKQDALMEHRRLIENDMEKFKVVEKIMKTKQFSTEALTNPDLIKDPKELKKRDQSMFVQECLEELQKQMELFETKDDQNQVERHEFHIANLENILKLLQNNDLSPETIQEFQDDIKYYVENNDDPDFIEYDTIYEDMNCAVVPGNEDSNLNDNNSIIESNNSLSKVNSSTTLKNKKLEKSPRKIKSLVSNTSTSIPASPSNGTAPTNEDSKIITKTTKSETNLKTTETKDEEVVERKIGYPPDLTPKINEEIENDLKNLKDINVSFFKNELKYWIEAKRPLMQPYKEIPKNMVSQLESSLLNCPDSLDADTPCYYRKPLSLPHPTSIFFPSEPIRFIYPQELPPSEESLNGMYSNVNDAEKSGNIFSTTTSSVSKNENGNNNVKEQENRINNDVSEDIYSRTSLAKIFTKFDVDTLFFIFYHYQGTYEQFLVARELSKHRNWKFNKIDRYWYYKEVTKMPPGMKQTEEETWRYFDYQQSWLARRCNADFKYKEEEFEKL